MDSRQKIINRFFSEKSKHCAECEKRIGTKASPRKRMLILGQEGRIGSISAYQLCIACAHNLNTNKMHLLPNITKDMEQMDLMFFGGHVGGMQ